MRASPAWIGRPIWRHLFDGTSTSPSIKHSHDSTNQLLRITRFPASEELMTTEFVIRRVGVVGLGHMGHAFAVNLVEDGHQVFVYDRDPKRTAALSGARAAGQLADLAACDVVLTSLPDALAEVALGAGVLVGGLAPGAVHISTSTVSPAISRRVAEEHARHRQDYIAAPVLGNPDFARERKLFVLAAG